ncbi:hydrogenase nickel incorporation protein HypA [Fundidesulfovibrio magnetotacticus]|uniref:Hydrogenase maturation factor HypA n=1 Tax=Fundidesulfovibrio magnetotacticus TaxID=2730080 RepID=A0A6V8LPG5_9BACT|nr:hydrogenase maturation nickel metallochaperone HypA [Fundidesulfovibrio magnetotacticus]GFK92208.1 hydrogenase nickel incorporation protein HypA [Fundidesulfovibrio magnetotacticus]
MHEMSIAQSILDIVQQEMEKNGLTRLIRVKVKFGRLTNTVPEALDTGFMALTAQTPLESAVFELEEIPARYRCFKCAAEFTPEGTNRLLVPCTACGEEFGHAVLSGKELYIDFIEAE